MLNLRSLPDFLTGTVTALALLSALGSASHAQEPIDKLSLHPLFSNHMVVQSDTSLAVTGWAPPGEILIAQGSWGSERADAADAFGRFSVMLETPPAGGPHSLLVQCSAGKVEVEDIWSGEVWLCSGQSNMEWHLGTGIEGGDQAIAEANDPGLRFFNVGNSIEMGPQDSCVGEWSLSTPESAASFSATAYFFGRELRRELQVPVGLITSDWGGTPVEAWMSAEALRDGFEEFTASLDTIADVRDRKRGEPTDLANQRLAWWQHMREVDPVFLSGRDAHDKAWPRVQMPVEYDALELAAFDGNVWFRTEFDLSEHDLSAADEWALELGPIDDMDVAWINGREVGGTQVMGAWQTPRRYVLPQDCLRAGSNGLTVLTIDTGGAGGLTGDAQALRLVGGDEAFVLPLAGEWSWMKGASMAEMGPMPNTNWFNSHSPSSLFNGMLHPLKNYAVAGTIWYQGESNVGRGEQYGRLFPAFIEDLRQQFGSPEMPFGFVQIAPFNYGNEPGAAFDLREAQRRSLSVPHTGMACTMDIGNPVDIHPRNKLDVGRRLSLWALSQHYGKTDLAYSGPIYRGFHRENQKLRLFFDHAEGLSSKGGAPSHLEIAGDDGVFHPALGVIDGETLLIESAEVAVPTQARYGFGHADQPNLFNSAGLPASSFRTGS